MSVSIALTGLRSLDMSEDRALVDIEVTYNTNVYIWQIYLPKGTTNIAAFLESSKTVITADIDAKEAEWIALTPKTRVIVDPFGSNITVDINKSEIVHATVPDYYALRRLEYPSTGDQLGALWLDKQDPVYIAMKNSIDAVKTKFPKK